MPLFENNLSPYLTIVEATEPAAPSAGQQRLYIDSTTHLLKATNSSGTDRTLEGAAAGAITSSGLTQATARLLGRTTASTGAIEEITVGSGLTLSAGSLTATAGSGAVATNSVKRTAGDISLTNDTSWHDIGTISDLSIAAASGDVLELTLGATTDNATRFEFLLVTSGNYAGPGVTSTQGIAYLANRVAGAGNSSGSILYTVVSGDISGGNVAIRLRYTTNSSGATKVFATATVGPLFVAVKNLKQ